MTQPPTPIRGLPLSRRATFGNPATDHFVDQMVDAINNIGGQKEALGVGRLGFEAMLAEGPDLTKTDTIFNTSTLVLTTGQVLGFSDGIPALAYALSGSLVVPFGVCVVSTHRQADVQFGSHGTWPVRLESSSISPAPGEAAWVSADTAGTATNVRPAAANWKILLGQFVKEKDPVTGLCDTTILIGAPTHG